MTNDSPFEVRHSWGDPREPEYHDGLPVSFLEYHETDLRVYFRLVGHRAPDSDDVRWVLEVPAVARKTFGNRWAHRRVAFNRVIAHIEQLNARSDMGRRGLTFKRISIDTSRVPSWWTVKREMLSVKLLPLTMTLPSWRCAVPLAAGFLVGHLDRICQSACWSSPTVATLLVLLAIASLFVLIREGHRQYQTFALVLAFTALAKPGYNSRLESLKLLMRHFAARCALTLALAAALIGLAIT